MRILLVYANRYRYMAPPPIGIAYLIEPLLRDGHEVRVVDLMFSIDPQGELQAAIEDFKPDVAGFSLRNIDNQDMLATEYFYPEEKKYLDIAINKKITTVLGGTAFTTFPAETLAYMGADYGIAGQGERSFPRLLRSLKERRPDETIPGLVWRDDGIIKMNPPDFSGYGSSNVGWGALKLNGYAGGVFPGAVITKAGCPHKCAYCNVTSTFGNRFRFRDARDIVNDIKSLKLGQGISHITLTDACFNVPLDYAKKVLRAIAGAGLDVSIHTSLVPVKGHYDDEFFELYKSAGGVLLSLGAETLSEKMLRNYNKPFGIEDVLAAAGLCNKHKVPFMLHALFGGPGENEGTIKETMDLLPRLHCSDFVYGMGVRIMPGTILFEVAKKEGIIKNVQELFAPKFYVSKDLDIAWADAYIKTKLEECGLRDVAKQRQPAFLLHNSIF